MEIRRGDVDGRNRPSNRPQRSYGTPRSACRQSAKRRRRDVALRSLTERTDTDTVAGRMRRMLEPTPSALFDALARKSVKPKASEMHAESADLRRTELVCRARRREIPVPTRSCGGRHVSAML
jgi:hypothetical protein